MDNPDKFSNSKEVIAFLAETFPTCFSTEGDAKPLKIGIFQDLAEHLEQEPRLSKTLLRASLRHYTNSWRYLYSVKEGAQRVDLQGQPGDVIEKDHAEHALQQLQESKAKVSERRKAEAKRNNAEKIRKKPPVRKAKEKVKGTKTDKPRTNIKSPPPQKLSEEHLIAGTAVTVKIGKAPMAATIKDVVKDGIQVQLDSGMVIKVQTDNLRLARMKE